MRSSARQEEICVRTGGDEFVVLAKNYDQAKEEAYMRHIREQLDQALKRAGKNYRITVSIGCFRRTPDAAGSLSIQSEAELFLRSADEAMYLEKQKA